MMHQTTIIILAVIGVGGFFLWFWIDAAILPRQARRYRYYGLMGGLAFSVGCFASFAALAVLQSGQALIGWGLILSLGVGLIIGIGMASPYWVSEKIDSRHNTINGDSNDV